MKQFSTILTKVNTVQLAFKDQIGLKKQEPNDNLVLFINYMHKNAEIIPAADCIKVHTSKGSYIYYNLGSYFKRINLNNDNDKFYKVS